MLIIDIALNITYLALCQEKYTIVSGNNSSTENVSLFVEHHIIYNKWDIYQAQVLPAIN